VTRKTSAVLSGTSKALYEQISAHEAYLVCIRTDRDGQSGWIGEDSSDWIYTVDRFTGRQREIDR